ncbi:UNVERIFIED_ORG: hypothetical protein JN05_02621 [Zoogloea ramigera]|uniref:Uncharacterized protein n=1 Tax=Duganella zoogloeoides TaxID=75659 RepID=A0ABZ0XUS1_9BURK|nr:hypothetical protein [Duganella zoogloeoides]WQH03494.1 hypothetical protein SR858_20940 [Duganella zoogloeoides]
MRYQHWAAIVIIASAVSGCVVEGGDVSHLSARPLDAPLESAIGAVPAVETGGHLATGVMYAKVSDNGQVHLAPALGEADSGKVTLAPAVKLRPEQYLGNMTMKLCGTDC